MRVETQSGTTYEFKGNRVRRSGGGHLRRDGEWLRLLNTPVPVLGRTMVLHLEPLGEEPCVYTLRETTEVVSVEV